MRAMIAVSACLAAALAFSACSSPAKRAPAAPPPTATVNPYPQRDVTVEQLQAMALTLDEFGPRYATFGTAIDAPMTAVLERALMACDVEKEQTALSEQAWVRGYARHFDQPEGSGHETLTVGSDLDLFSTAQNAIAKIAYDNRSLQENARRSASCNGFSIERIEQFEVTGIGDEAGGLRINFSYLGVRGQSTVVYFRRDRLVAQVSVARLNSEDSSAEMIELAKKIDARMLPVLTSPLT